MDVSCGGCGAGFPAEAKFCGSCGARQREVVWNEALSDADDDLGAVTRRRRWPLRVAVAICFILAAGGVALGVSYKWKYDDSIATRMGDVGALDVRIASLRDEQARRRQELEDVRLAIADARTALAAAERESRAARCHATNAQLDAEITVRQVRCFQVHAEAARCLAANSEAEAEGTRLGLLAGLGLALATGGGSLLVAGGALVGSAGAEQTDCPQPACTIDPEVLEPEVLRARGLSRRDACNEPLR